MNKRTMIIILILSLAFNLAFMGSLGYKLWQKKDIDTRAPRFDRQNGESPEQMNFRQEEREQIDKIRETFEPKINEIQSKLMEERKQLGSLLMEEHLADHPDTLLIYQHIDEIGRLQTELEKEVTHQLFMARTVLDSAGQRQFFWMLGRRMGSDFPDMRSPRQNN
ncbi:periplasmic heavy metal sensor, partial [bacterium]|nr:periplasmic heavy metal sensor [bacterium]